MKRWIHVGLLFWAAAFQARVVVAADAAVEAGGMTSFPGRTSELRQYRLTTNRENLKNPQPAELFEVNRNAWAIESSGTAVEKAAAQIIRERTERQLGVASMMAASPRIVGGRVAPDTDFRYQVALVFTGYPNPRAGQFCGGTLVGQQWVVTAAHCVISPTVPTGLRNTDLYVFAGSHKLSAGGRRIAVQSVKWNASYDPSDVRAGNDIAVLKLSETLTATEESLTLLTETLEQQILQQVTTGVITGWGDTVEGAQQGSDDLLYAPVRILERQTCNAPASYNGTITSVMVCAGGVNADSCQGDSGGPLALTFGTTTYLYGIVSWGDGCGRVNKPGIYTRVPSYITWLRQAMQ